MNRLFKKSFKYILFISLLSLVFLSFVFVSCEKEKIDDFTLDNDIYNITFAFIYYNEAGDESIITKSYSTLEKRGTYFNPDKYLDEMNIKGQYYKGYKFEKILEPQEFKVEKNKEIKVLFSRVKFHVKIRFKNLDDNKYLMDENNEIYTQDNVVRSGEKFDYSEKIISLDNKHIYELQGDAISLDGINENKSIDVVVKQLYRVRFIYEKYFNDELTSDNSVLYDSTENNFMKIGDTFNFPNDFASCSIDSSEEKQFKLLDKPKDSSIVQLVKVKYNAKASSMSISLLIPDCLSSDGFYKYTQKIDGIYLGAKIDEKYYPKEFEFFVRSSDEVIYNSVEGENKNVVYNVREGDVYIYDFIKGNRISTKEDLMTNSLLSQYKNDSLYDLIGLVSISNDNIIEYYPYSALNIDSRYEYIINKSKFIKLDIQLKSKFIIFDPNTGLPYLSYRRLLDESNDLDFKLILNSDKIKILQKETFDLAYLYETYTEEEKNIIMNKKWDLYLNHEQNLNPSIFNTQNIKITNLFLAENILDNKKHSIASFSMEDFIANETLENLYLSTSYLGLHKFLTDINFINLNKIIISRELRFYDVNTRNAIMRYKEVASDILYLEPHKF